MLEADFPASRILSEMTANSDVERLETALRRSLQRQAAIARFGTRVLVAIDLDAQGRRMKWAGGILMV